MTTAQEILSAYPSDMEPEEWALVLPGLQSRMIEAEQSAAAFKEARNIAMERALDGAKELVIEGYKYAKVTKTTYSEVKLARDYPELVDSIITDLRLAYKPKITKAVIDKELAKLPEDRRLEIQRDILGDSEISYTATAVKAAKGKGVLLITKPCPYCKKVQKVAVPESGLRMWMSGTRIQDALPMLSADEREIVKSGICPECWDAHHDVEVDL